MEILRLYHTGFQVIETPDLTIGRKNADFGQGFYLSDDEEFSRRWARERKGASVYLNTYELDLTGLTVKCFDRDEEWFAYIYENRAGRADALADFDVIAGPIANDTIYNTMGIITSGFLKKEEAIQLLLLGPRYTQVVIKTPKAAAALRFTGAVTLSPGEIASYREIVKEEEQQFQRELTKLLEDLSGE